MTGALTAVLIALAAAGAYGALAAAVASLVGALVVNARAIAAAYIRSRNSSFSSQE